MNYYAVDEDYLRNMGLTLVAGKFFQAEAGKSNERSIVLSEKAVDRFHFASPQDAVGQELIFQNDSSKVQIIGVVKDYTHQLLMEEMQPLALVYRPWEFAMLQVQYTGTFQQAQESIERAWLAVNPALKVDYKDFDAEVHKIYDIFFGDLVSVLGVIAFLAVFVSSLGLLGMATYTTESRLKEISVRKILGSSNSELIMLLSKGFVTVLGIAVVLGVPAAYFLNNLWLEKMARHITINGTMILAGVLVLLAFAAVTIGSQTWRATYVNPVDNLKSE